MTDIYSELLLQHARTPENYGVQDVCSCTITVHNEGCADTLTLYVTVNEESMITDVSFSGTLCALSTASASLYTEYIKGKTIQELKLLTPASVYELVHIPINPMRTRCVLLCYDALQKTLNTCFV
jgi:nitrogen fixation protein NifU and related proteins